MANLIVPSVLAAVLALTPAFAQKDEGPPKKGVIRALLITGQNNHDWEYTSPRLAEILVESGRFKVTVTRSPGTDLAADDLAEKFDVFVLDYNGKRWGAAAEQNFVKAVESGVGVSIVHASNNPFPGWVEYEKMCALMWRKGTGHGVFHPFDVKITDRDHPITRDMPDMRMHPDELYHRMVHMHNTDYRLLATAMSSEKSRGTGKAEPMILVKNWGKGRIFHTPLGHVWRKQLNTHASYADPQFRNLVARGSEWAATGKVTLPGQPPNFLTVEEKKQGFRMIFNGRKLTGWRNYKQKAAKGWVVQHGAIMLPPGARAGDLMTEDQFGEFDFRFEFKVAKNSNSGVIYRVRETQGSSYMTGPEYQVLDANARSAKKHASAALYDMIPAEGSALHSTGEYNTGRIVIRKGRLQHWLNGKKVVDCSYGDDEWKARVSKSKFKKWGEFGVHPSGHLALQDHGGQVWYRSLRIREFK